MQIIDYFTCNDQPHWRAAIADNEWRAAKYLARLLEQGSGAACFFAVLGVIGVMVCITFRRNKHLRAMQAEEMTP